MIEFFIGVFILMLDVTGAIHAVRIGFFPDFIGYILIYHAQSRLRYEGAAAKRLKKLALPFAALSAAAYAGNLLGASEFLYGFGGYLLDLGMAVLAFWAAYLATAQFRTGAGAEKQARRLYSAWLSAVIFAGLAFLALLCWRGKAMLVAFGLRDALRALLPGGVYAVVSGIAVFFANSRAHLSAFGMVAKLYFLILLWRAMKRFSGARNKGATT